MHEPRLFSDWRPEPNNRWRDAFHTFGHLLMTHARDGAVANALPQNKEIAEKAATDALYNLMMILEGVVSPSIGENHSLEFALVARVREREQPYSVAEQFELAPEGLEGLCMGFHLWTDGEFRV